MAKNDFTHMNAKSDNQYRLQKAAGLGHLGLQCWGGEGVCFVVFFFSIWLQYESRLRIDLLFDGPKQNAMVELQAFEQ